MEKKRRKQTPSEEYTNIQLKLFDDFLGSQIASARSQAQQRDLFEHLPGDEQRDILHRAEGQAVLYAIKTIESFLYQARKKYKDQIDLIRQTDYWPRRWMLDDKQIAAVLQKHPLAKILNVIEGHVLNYGDKDTLSCFGPTKYMTFRADKAFYRDLMEATGKSRRILSNYLQSLTEMEAITRVKRVNGIWLYGFGYWQQIPNSGRRPNRVRFLSEKTHKEKLRDFKLPWQRHQERSGRDGKEGVVEWKGNSVDRSDTTPSLRGAKLLSCFSKQTRSAPHNENRKSTITSQPQKTGLRCNN